MRLAYRLDALLERACVALGRVVVLLPRHVGVVVTEDGGEAPGEVGTTAVALVHRWGGEGRHVLLPRCNELFTGAKARLWFLYRYVKLPGYLKEVPKTDSGR